MRWSEDERRRRHRDFIQANLLALAAFAWEHFQQEGRGAVLVDERDFIHAPQPRYAVLHYGYVAERSERLRALGGWPGDREAGWVATYDPDERFVVFVVREEQGLSSYFVNSPTKPSQAHAQQSARGN